MNETWFYLVENKQCNIFGNYRLTFNVVKFNFIF